MFLTCVFSTKRFFAFDERGEVGIGIAYAVSRPGSERGPQHTASHAAVWVAARVSLAERLRSGSSIADSISRQFVPKGQASPSKPLTA
jgi:hypothetical protein